MHIYLVGGVNGHLQSDEVGYDDYGFGANHYIRQLIDEIQACDPTKVAIVSASKEDKYFFSPMMHASGIDVDQAVTLNFGDTPEWSAYEVVILNGGETRRLHKYLVEAEFSLDKLTSCKMLVGESAGSYVLCAKTILDYSPDGNTELEIVDGFNPTSNILTVAHVNNDYYHREGFDTQIREYCQEHNLTYLPLSENEIHKL